MAEAEKAAKEKAAAKEEWTGGEGDEAVVEARKAAPYYCPACGKPSQDENAECTGTDENPHQATPVADTSELDGDPEKHTAAPASE